MPKILSICGRHGEHAADFGSDAAQQLVEIRQIESKGRPKEGGSEKQDKRAVPHAYTGQQHLSISLWPWATCLLPYIYRLGHREYKTKLHLEYILHAYIILYISEANM